MQAVLGEAVGQVGDLGFVGHRGVRKGVGAWGLVGVFAAQAVDGEEALGLGVVGGELVVFDRPLGGDPVGVADGIEVALA